MTLSETRGELLAGAASHGYSLEGKLLGGGVDRGTSTLLFGPPGSGKSTVARQNVYAAVTRGEHAAIVAFDESRTILMARARGLGMGIPKGSGTGQLLIRQVDPARLVQIVGNLLNNAVKYTPENGAINLSLEAIGTQAKIEVRDNGVGIPPDMLPRVFDMFAQVEEARGRAKGGLGLGLSLVRSLLALHGGSVTTHSKGTGHGSTFTVLLPLSKPVGSSLLSEAPYDLVASSGLRVLIIDDNADAAEALSLSLLLRAHRTRCEHCGVDGLKTAASFAPHVIFCDVGMPGLNGYEVGKRIRADPAMSAAKLIALTGCWQVGERRLIQKVARASPSVYRHMIPQGLMRCCTHDQTTRRPS